MRLEYYKDKTDMGIDWGFAYQIYNIQEYLENIRSEFRSEGVELEEVSELPSEEVEVLEQPSEEILSEVLRWEEHVAMLGTAGRGSE